MKKRDGSINRLLYTLLALCVFIIMGMGVFIVNAYGGNQPSVMGHSAGEIEEADHTVLASVKDGVSWAEVTGKPTLISSETDPTVIASVKDGVSWSEISSIPADFADGVDNEGSSGITNCWVSGYSNCVSRYSGNIYSADVFCKGIEVVRGTGGTSDGASLLCCNPVISCS